VSGASRVETDGTAASIEADVSGASELDFAGVEAEVVVVNVSGASTVDVTVTEQLDAEASGASTVRYRGDPDVRVDASGSSSVERA
jgi:carbon monoxide dehydrogenase subunit G